MRPSSKPTDAETGMKCITYMLFTSNLMFSLIGFLLISVGSTIIAIYHDFEIFMEDNYFSPAALLIAIGVIIFFVSIFGCVGAIKQSTCLINIYGSLLVVILILEISAAITAYCLRDDIEVYVEESMTESLTMMNDPYVQNGWNFTQYYLGCCGIHSSSDWDNIYETIPKTCYPLLNNNTPIYTSGCLDRMVEVVYDCSTLIGTGAVCVAIVELLGIIFAFMLAKSVRRLKTELAMQHYENQQFYAQLARGNSNKPTPVVYNSPDVDMN